MTAITTTLNQVDLESVGNLVAAISADPSAANTTWKARVDWKGAFQSEATVRGFAPILSDEPRGLGGNDLAPNPVEQLLGALGNCLAVGYAASLSSADVTINSLTIELEGDLDLHTFLGLADGNAGYSGIRATVSIDADTDTETLTALHRRVVSTSPVGHTLTRAIPVSVELA